MQGTIVSVYVRNLFLSKFRSEVIKDIKMIKMNYKKRRLLGLETRGITQVHQCKQHTWYEDFPRVLNLWWSFCDVYNFHFILLSFVRVKLWIKGAILFNGFKIYIQTTKI